MKTILKLATLLLAIAFASCSDVIDVPLQTETPRLVIEASLDWEKGTTGNEQSIKLSTSTSFYDTTTNTAVTGASVRVTNDSDGTEFLFADQDNGEYRTTEFIPIIDQAYTLEVVYNGENYTATETLTPITDIDEIFQSRDDGDNVEDLEVQILFTDPPEEGNNFLFKFQKEGNLLPDLEWGNDEFLNGNQISWWYELEEDEDTDTIEAFVAGDVVDISFYGISEAYYNYVNVLFIGGGAGIFDTTPVAAKGNCINLSDPDNYAHGYFRLTEVVKMSYTFE